MTEQHNRPGQPGEDDRKRTQTTPEKGPQGKHDQKMPPNREDQGRGQNPNPAAVGAGTGHNPQQGHTGMHEETKPGQTPRQGDATNPAMRHDASRETGTHGQTSGRDAGSDPMKKDENRDPANKR